MAKLKNRKTCPICGKPADPNCSGRSAAKRCADVDLHRWFSGSYAIAATEDDEEDERREDDSKTN